LRSAERRFAIGLARAFAGALIFALPMLMTMELWWIGFYIDPWRLALLSVVALPFLIGLSHFSGFERTFGWAEDIRDAFIAYGVGWGTAAVILVVFAVITPSMPMDHVLGKIAVQAMPASIGAMLARSQLGGKQDQQEEEQTKEQIGYAGELFLMGVGALFLAMNVAPTEEMILLAYKMTNWHVLALIALSLMIMHGFVYAVEFQGSRSLPPGTPAWSEFLRFTVAGYALVLVISCYILWTFGRIDGRAMESLFESIVVLSFPAAIGAAAARVIV
jgi:putative integral membrane protein (TIGR02587 family)